METNCQLQDETDVYLAKIQAKKQQFVNLSLRVAIIYFSTLISGSISKAPVYLYLFLSTLVVTLSLNLKPVHIVILPRQKHFSSPSIDSNLIPLSKLSLQRSLLSCPALGYVPCPHPVWDWTAFSPAFPQTFSAISLSPFETLSCFRSP